MTAANKLQKREHYHEAHMNEGNAEFPKVSISILEDTFD